MDLSEIKELIAVMRKNKIKEIDLEQDGSKVRIVATEPPSKKAPPAPPAPLPVATYAAPPQFIAPAPVIPPNEAAAPVAAPAEPAPPAEEKIEGTEVTSPMVGTFYRSPAPDAPSYVDIGDVVNDDTVLCILEAMKLMNEIKAEMRGKILKVLVENGQPVEFGQPLFLMEKF